jgi:hypothetical protein
MQVADRDQRIHALFQRLANSNQNSRGERNLPPPASSITRRRFAGSLSGALSCAAPFEQPRAGRFQHEPHARSHAGQPLQPFRAHQSGIRMRQQARFAQHLLAHCFQIVQRGFVSQSAAAYRASGEKQLRLVSQAEQRLGTSHALSGAHDFHHLVRRHGVRAGLAGIAPECAVAAVVAAKIRQGKKHFARIGDDSRLESARASCAAESSEGSMSSSARSSDKPLRERSARRRRSPNQQPSRTAHLGKRWPYVSLRNFHPNSFHPNPARNLVPASWQRSYWQRS